MSRIPGRVRLLPSLSCREWEGYMRSVDLPKNIAKGISAEARRRPLSMTVSLSGSSMEVGKLTHSPEPLPGGLCPDTSHRMNTTLQQGAFQHFVACIGQA